MEDHAKPVEPDANTKAVSPSQRAIENIASVVTRRLTGELDEEQAQQTLEVLNDTRRED